MLTIVISAAAGFFFGNVLNVVKERRDQIRDDIQDLIELIREYASLSGQYWLKDGGRLSRNRCSSVDLIADENLMMQLELEITARIEFYRTMYWRLDEIVSDPWLNLTTVATGGGFGVRNRKPDTGRSKNLHSKTALLIERVMKMRSDLLPNGFFRTFF